MSKKLCIIALLVLTAGCKTVTTTTTEIRPARYAVLEFTRAVSHDSIVAYAERALRAESIRIQNVDKATGIVTGGPVKFAAQEGQPALDASVEISSQTQGANSKVRIYTSSAIEAGLVGGVDPRLMELAQRIERRLGEMIGH